MYNEPVFIRFLPLALWAVAAYIGGATAALALDRCIVADPSGTPLNVRTSPKGCIIGTLDNGDEVAILDRSSVSGEAWAYVGQDNGRVPLGWVYRNYLDCTVNASAQRPYTVEGLALGGKVRPGSEAYKQFRCRQSDAFPAATAQAPVAGARARAPWAGLRGSAICLAGGRSPALSKA
jgi:Bacterial SH3 domain